MRNIYILIFHNFAGEYIKIMIKNVCSSFNVSLDQIYTITTDNGSNMVKAARILSSEYGDCDVEILEQDKNDDDNINLDTHLELSGNEDDSEHKTDHHDLNIFEELETENTNASFQNNILTGNGFLH